MKKILKYSIIGLLFSVICLSVIAYQLARESEESIELPEENVEETSTDETEEQIIYETADDVVHIDELEKSIEDSNEESEPDPNYYEESIFELPVIGAAGYVSTDMFLFDAPFDMERPAIPENGRREIPVEIEWLDVEEEDEQVIRALSTGTPFMIMEERTDWWKIQLVDGVEGWIPYDLAMINLPDVLPSVVYDNPNNYGSTFRSSFEDIPEVTGEVLYDGIRMNERLGYEEFIMPILYPTAEKLAYAQEKALENNETLVINETFRPRSVQLFINQQLEKLMEENETVRLGIETEPWSMTWFINTGISNHQRGLAVDLSFAEIHELGEVQIGEYTVPNVVEYTEHEMHTPVFELSTHSVMVERPIAARDRTGWKDLEILDHVHDNALRLRELMYSVDLIPLASEWWHFNDIDTMERYEGHLGDGDFYFDEFFNFMPSSEESE